MSVTYVPVLEASPKRDLTRWALCFVIILLAHAVGIMALLRQQDEGGEPPGAPPAVMLDLSPLPAAPAAVTPADAPPGPLQAQTADQPLPADRLERVQPPEPQVSEEARIEPPKEEMPPPLVREELKPLEQQPEQPVRPEAVQRQELPVEAPVEAPRIPDLAPAIDPEVAIAVPPPPVEAERARPRPEARPVRTPKATQKKPERPKPRPQSAAATTAPAASARPARPSPPRVAAVSNSASMPAWKAQLAAHLQRFKRYPADAQARGEQGVAMLHFVIDRNGRVLSSRLSRSSGVASLDRDALSLPQRAQPFPRPPADVTGQRFPFDVPIRYSVR